jgi:hypothetical protein
MSPQRQRSGIGAIEWATLLFILVRAKRIGGTRPTAISASSTSAEMNIAFMESIGRGALKTRFIPSSQLKGTALAKIRFKESLRFIDMVTSGGLTRFGTESSLASGSGYKNSQRWSQALRQHPSNPDGIYYRSRHDPARTACALFDHCAHSVVVAEALGTWADQPALLGEILDHYAFGTDV